MVLFGRGLEIVDSYEPLLSALRRFIECAPDDLIAQIDVTAAGALYRLVPDMARRRPDVVGHVSTWGDVDRGWLFTAAATGVRQAGPGGVLMLLDDVQWASRSALVLLARLIDVAHVKVLMTCRTPLHDGCHIGELLAELRRQDRRVRRIALDGLSDGDVGELLSSTRRVEPSAARDALAAALRRRTDGNAFFVREALRQLDAVASAGSVDDPAALERLVAELGAPEGVADVLGQRLTALPRATRDVLDAAAVGGIDIDVDVVARVLDRTADDIADAMDEAVRAGLIEESTTGVGRYRFLHALTREVVVARDHARSPDQAGMADREGARGVAPGRHRGGRPSPRRRAGRRRSAAGGRVGTARRRPLDAATRLRGRHRLVRAGPRRSRCVGRCRR